MKKNTNIYTIIIVFTMFFSTKFIFAADPYKLLEPNAFPGISSTASLSDFLAQIFNFGIAIAVVLALIMIIWGGIEYMTADSWFKKNGGKAKVTDALLGLGLALISYLILYTINPCLVNFKAGNGCETSNSFLYAPSRENLNPPSASNVVNSLNTTTGILGPIKDKPKSNPGTTKK